ncbi:MAG TPA: ABC transporter permease subunit [Casimicrobiaceae bacterium]|nr:ABC transporter permease subunit [Casimicrobiaceae bacterium]
MRIAAAPVSVVAVRLLPTRWDLIVVPLLLVCFVILGHGARQMAQPLSALETAPLTLAPAALPGYALRTTLRMLAALLLSLVFTFTYGTLAAKNRRAGALLVPLLDILQSVPILGFLSFTVTFFLGLFPGNVLGAECAAIFAIFTSQAWNMAFSFYQSLRTLPRDLDEATRSFGLSAWQRFWRLEVPFSIPGLVWNTMMSMSGGWFFVVASEAISVGKTTITLPGIGSYVALAIAERDLAAVGWAVLAMLVVILIYDQVLFRPIVAWAEKFRFEQTASGEVATSWFLTLLRRSFWVRWTSAPIRRAWRRVMRKRNVFPELRVPNPGRGLSTRTVDWIWYTALALVAAYAAWHVLVFVFSELGLLDLLETLGLGALTLLRVLILIGLATLIWVPVGVWIGLRPRLAEALQPLAQFLAAFPANLLFPVAVVTIVRFHLSPDVWLSPLMVLGTQWYILFNVIAGTTAFPGDLKEAAASLRLTGWPWWRNVILPGIFPYYVTGAITASGGSWNASIVAEVASWGETHLQAHGLGAYIAQATDAGDYPRLVLGIAVMSFFVVALNRVLWRPLYAFAERRLRIN